MFQAGTANNVIPSTARLELSVRALDREVRRLLRQRIQDIAAAQASSLGVAAEVDDQEGSIRCWSTPAPKPPSRPRWPPSRWGRSTCCATGRR